MNKYEKIYRQILNGKIYKNKEYTDLLKRIINTVTLYDGHNDKLSNLFLENLLLFLDYSHFDCNLIDDNFLLMTSPHNINYSYFIDLLKTIFVPIDSSYFGTYMEVFSAFLYRDLMNEDNKEYVNDLKYQKLKDLNYNYLEFRNDISKLFNYSYDYDLPILLYGYYYGNNLDLNEVNDILYFYINNRNYYLDKMQLNGLFYPYNDDDSIPKFFIREYQNIFMQFIPILINDFKRLNTNKKKIK